MDHFKSSGASDRSDSEAFGRFMDTLFGSRESLSDLIITERDTAEMRALKRARVDAMIRTLGGTGTA